MNKFDRYISTIKAGDTVEFNGNLRTVCNRDITYCEFFGLKLFGDSFNLGRKPVTLVIVEWRNLKENK